MGKKILAILGAIVIVAIIVLGITTCGVMKIANETLKEKEPQLRQYVQMTEAEQNEYVLKNMDELIAAIAATSTPDDDPDYEKAQKSLAEMKNDPEYRAAGLKLGRSIVAMFIISSDPIVADLSPEDKAKYQAEADQLETNLDAYMKVKED